jgi:site-specific DNA-methyltransferase (adenine-specific)
MHEVHCRNGTLVISEDPDDGDQIIVEPAINVFSPVRGTLHCVCGGTTGSVERALHCRRLSRIVLPSLSSRTRRHWAWPEHIPQEVVSMLARQHIILNVAQRRDALDLLCSLPDACTPLVFFDPQHRSVLDQLKFGNEGARQRGRAQLPAMTEDDIDAISIEIARVRPSGYLMHWMDTHNLCEAHHLRVRDHLQPVYLIAWDSLRIGMGERSRRRGDYLIVLQKPPVKAGTTWRDHGIPSRWPERVDRKLHPHVKPIGLITRLIAATAEIVISSAIPLPAVLSLCMPRTLSDADSSAVISLTPTDANM